jgi:hypothetical protein
MRFAVETRASPDQARRALIDFSERRPQIWSRTLDPSTYELRDRGESWAVARESTSGSPFWVVVRYDWSDPALLRWTVEESSYGGKGEGWVRIAPRGDGGSRLEVAWRYTDALRQKPLLFLLQHLPIDRMISRMWRTALDRYAASDGG